MADKNDFTFRNPDGTHEVVTLPKSEIQASELIQYLISTGRIPEFDAILRESHQYSFFDYVDNKILDASEMITPDSDDERYSLERVKSVTIICPDKRKYDFLLKADERLSHVIAQAMPAANCEPIDDNGVAFYPVFYSLTLGKILEDTKSLTLEGVKSGDTLKIIDGTPKNPPDSKINVYIHDNNYVFRPGDPDSVTAYVYLSLNPDTSIKYLMPSIVQRLELPLFFGDRLSIVINGYTYYVLNRIPDHYPYIELESTLREAGIKDGERLWVFPPGVGGGGYMSPSASVSSGTITDVHFTGYAPRKVSIEKRYSLIVYAHTLADLEIIRENMRKFEAELGEGFQNKASKTKAPLLRGSVIRITPECDNLEFQPRSLEQEWDDDWLRYIFEFTPKSTLIDEILVIRFSITVGVIEIASLRFALDVVASDATQLTENPLTAAQRQNRTITPYGKVFLSYSRRDKKIARRQKISLRAYGEKVFIDVEDLRSGENWQAGLATAIDDADVFHLLWSTYSAKSRYCQYEWKHALASRCADKNCDGFIRPVYWREPMPPPPTELAHLNFTFASFEVGFIDRFIELVEIRFIRNIMSLLRILRRV